VVFTKGIINVVADPRGRKKRMRLISLDSLLSG